MFFSEHSIHCYYSLGHKNKSHRYLLRVCCVPGLVLSALWEFFLLILAITPWGSFSSSDLLLIVLVGWFSYCWVWKIKENILDTAYVFCKYLFLVRGLSSHAPNHIFCGAEVCNFSEVQLIIFFSFFLSWILLLVLYLKTHLQTHGHLDFSSM